MLEVQEIYPKGGWERTTPILKSVQPKKLVLFREELEDAMREGIKILQRWVHYHIVAAC